MRVSHTCEDAAVESKALNSFPSAIFTFYLVREDVFGRHLTRNLVLGYVVPASPGFVHFKLQGHLESRSVLWQYRSASDVRSARTPAQDVATDQPTR